MCKKNEARNSRYRYYHNGLGSYWTHTRHPPHPPPKKISFNACYTPHTLGAGPVTFEIVPFGVITFRDSQSAFRTPEQLPIFTKSNFILWKGWEFIIDTCIKLNAIPGGRDCLSLSAFSLSWMTRVYRYRLHRTLNLTVSLIFFIFTAATKQL